MSSLNRTRQVYGVSDIFPSSEERPGFESLGDGIRSLEWRPPAVLEARTKSTIYKALVPTSTLAFGADMEPYWRDRKAGGYLDNITRFVLLFDEYDALIGWTGYHLMNQTEGRLCVYVDSTGLIPTRQSRGTMRRLYQRLFGSEPALARPGVYVTARSESPIFHRLFCALFGPTHVYPRPGAEIPSSAMTCATELADELGQSSIFEPESLRVLGAYSNLDALYGELPSSGVPDVDRFFREQLGPLDAFLLVADPVLFRMEAAAKG